MGLETKKNFDLDNYSGLFFEKLAAARREICLKGRELTGANGKILRRAAMGAGTT